MGHLIELAANDGHRFQAWRADPSGRPRGGLVVAPEIFGVNSHMRAVTEAYAAAGYACLCPALFDRARHGYESGYAPGDIQAGIALMQQVPMDSAMEDVKVCIAALSATGRVGIVGYCWGGTVAWVAAARLEGLACSIPYYGGGIHAQRQLHERCPVLFHFAEQDTSPTLAQAQEIAAAHPTALAHFYPAGHGFNCDQRGSWDAASATLARERSLAFLATHVG